MANDGGLSNGPIKVSIQLSNLNILRGEVNESSPAVEYEAEKDLGLSDGQQACFRVRAYRASAVSSYSDEVCTTM